MAATASPAATSSTPDGELVTVAFRLGWHMAELYARDIARQQPDPPTSPPADLPGLSSLSTHERNQLLADEITADLHLLTPTLTVAGIVPADPQPAINALNDFSQSAAAVQLQLYTLHKQLLVQLWSADFRLGKAYGLGRALADTTLLPNASQPRTFHKEFEANRTDGLADWLDELSATFPDHAAGAVAYSLRTWTAWVTAHIPVTSSDPATPTTESDTKRADETLDMRLREQGRLWRTLLSGEKRAEDLLKTDDYVSAAEQLVASTASLVYAFAKKNALAIVVSLSAFAGLLAVFFVYLRGGAETATVITTILAAAGLSWKSVGSTLGKVITRAEQPIWQHELSQAVADAATFLPPDGDPRSRA